MSFSNSRQTELRSKGSRSDTDWRTDFRANLDDFDAPRKDLCVCVCVKLPSQTIRDGDDKNPEYFELFGLNQ